MYLSHNFSSFWSRKVIREANGQNRNKHMTSINPLLLNVQNPIHIAYIISLYYSLFQSHCKHTIAHIYSPNSTYLFLKSIHAMFNCIYAFVSFFFLFCLDTQTPFWIIRRLDYAYFEITSWKSHVLAQASVKKKLAQNPF